MRLSLRSQLVLSSVSGIVLVCVAAIGGAYWSLSRDLDTQKVSEINRAAECAISQLDAELAMLTRIGKAVASRPDLVQAMEKQDRTTLCDLARSLMKTTDVDLVTICDKTGCVLSRGHSDKAGDNVLNQRVVVRALEGEANAGIESGTVMPLILRCGCPIRSGSNVIGVVTVGTDPFSNHGFVDSIKKRYGLECTIFHRDLRISTTILQDGKRAVGTALENPAIKLQTLEQGVVYHGTAEIIGTSYRVSYSPLHDADGSIQGMLFLGFPLAEIAQIKNRLLLASVTPVALGALGALAIAVWLARRIANPLRSLAQGLAEVTRGKWDLTRRFTSHGDDEVAVATRSVNTLLEMLQVVLRDVGKEATQVAQSSSELSAAATQLSDGTHRIAGESGAVAGAAEELTANITNMAAATQEMSANAKTIASAVEEMTASITEVARNAEQAAGVAANVTGLAHLSNGKINELGAAAGEIGSVVEVIKEIAEQTKLLALNATIEAARAGDAGKGFAVVANEVKELARQTAEATGNIERRIGGIQSSTTEAVRAMGEISQAIESVHAVSRSIASAVEEQSITTKEIAASVMQSSAVIDSVAKGVSHSAQVSRDITGSIHQIDTTVQETADGATVAEQSSARLQQITQTLRAMVDMFHTS